MMMKNKLGLAVASVLLMASVAAPSAFAAQPVPVKKDLAASSTAGYGHARLIVKYKAGTAASNNVTAKLTSVRSAASRAGVAQSATGVRNAVPLNTTYVRRLGLGGDAIKLSRRLNDAEMDKLLIELRADASVQSVQVDRMMHAVEDLQAPTSLTAVLASAASRVGVQMTPTDPHYVLQWHYSNPNGGINAPAAWDISTGHGTVVAVLDTGILPQHPDLENDTHILEGYDFITDTMVSRRATTERAAGALDYGDWNDDANECPVRNSTWHGTHTAGTIGELTNNAIGGAGVAFDAQILPVRVLGRCGGYNTDIADAIAWASGASIAGVADNANPAEVISLSLGGYGACDAYTQEAINLAVANGSLVVVAAGNDGENVSSHTPANCQNVITVGANRITGGRASYSNYGAAVDIAAPGGGGRQDTGNEGWDGYVLSTGYNGTTTPTSGTYQYTGYSGTSMATPHVSAVAALVQSALVAADKPALTPAAMEALLKETARPFPVTIPSGTPIGAGILNAKAALDKALEEPCDPEVQTCAPAAIPLVNRVNVTGLTGYAGKETLYSFNAAPGTVLSIMTLGGTGDVSLYVSYGSEPTATVYGFKSTRAGNSETVRVTAPQAGTYYIRLVGVAPYAGVTLLARQ